MWVALNVLGTVAFLALCVVLVAAPSRWYRRRREAHYSSNPDPLFAQPDVDD